MNTSSDLTSSAGNSGTACDTLTVTDPGTTFSISTAAGSGTVTGNISGGGPSCTIGTASATTAVAGSGPPGVAFPHGLVAFRFDDCDTGAVVTVTLTFSAPLPTGTQYWKYGPTAADPSPHWYVLPAMFAGTQVTFSLTDGGLGDHDLTPNGTIVDPGGPSGTAAADDAAVGARDTGARDADGRPARSAAPPQIDRTRPALPRYAGADSGPPPPHLITTGR